MKKIALFICFLCVCLSLASAPKEFHFFGTNHITQDHGLSNNTVHYIHRDWEGFVWVGTDVGLSRYDGTHFHNYYLMDKEPYAVKRICEPNRDDLLWLITSNSRRLACFDKLSGDYLTLEAEQPHLLTGIKDLCTADSTLYVLTSIGIERLDYKRENGIMRVKAQPVLESACKLSNLQTGGGYLYAVNEKGHIHVYHLQTGKNTLLDDSTLPAQVEVNNIHAFNNCLWINAQHSLAFCYLPEKNVLRPLDIAGMSHHGQSFTDVDQLNDSTFLIVSNYTTYKVTFDHSDLANASYQTYHLSAEDVKYYKLVRDRITHLLAEPSQSVVWLGTFGKGLVQINLQNPQIGMIRLPDEIKSVNNVLQDTRGYIWLTTDYSGVYRSRTTEISPDMTFERFDDGHPDAYYCMHKDVNGNLWVANEHGNIYRINPILRQAVVHYSFQHDSQPIRSIRHMKVCVHNNLWVVTDSGISVLNIREGTELAHYTYDGILTRVNTLCEDNDGFMWLGTNDGVRRASVVDGQILLEDGYEERSDVSRSEVLNIYMNKYNQLYVSYENKLLQTDGLREEVENVRLLYHDMQNGHIKCIIDDKAGNTWLGNNSGITLIYNKNKSSYTYPFSERFYGVCQLNDNRLMWINSNGLIYFDPRTLKNSFKARPLHISDVEINYNIMEIGEKVNGQVILTKPAHHLDNLTLQHNNNNVIFYLTNLTFNDALNRIEYRFLPEQQEWTKCYWRKIEFSNLSPGKYTLEVRQTSIDGEKTPITRLKIRVKKHWAVTSWAFIVYFLVVAFIARMYFLYKHAKAAKRRYYKKKEELLKGKLLKESRKRKEEKEMQQLRNQARYGLAQELRTPLSMVIAPLREMVATKSFPESLQPKLDIAYRNSISIQDTCSQLLNIYEQENEESRLKVAAYPICTIMEKVLASAFEVLDATPVQLHYDKACRIKKEVWIDRQKVNFMLQTTLSNAFRHVSYSGNVYCSHFLKTVEGKDYCCFQIKDDGKDAFESSAVYLLNQEEENNEMSAQLHPETGILLMKEYIIAHKGVIRIEQDKEKGTCVTIYLLMGKEHLEQSAGVLFIEGDNEPDIDLTHILVNGEGKRNTALEEEMTVGTHTAGRHKLLIIEDNKDIRLYLKMLFAPFYNLSVAENGEEGVRLARKELPDLIITDITMPMINGLECTRILKEDLKTCHIPIIMLTSQSGEKNVVNGIEVGADDYILKPFNPEILRSKVRHLIKNRQELKQAYMQLLVNNASPKQPEDAEEQEHPLVQQIFDLVEQHMQDPDFGVKKLAEMLNMSQPTLYRKVKMLTNYTIVELIRGVRMKHAAELLKTRRYSVQEVSEMVGYNDVPTFRKHFVNIYGKTPLAFINKMEEEMKK